MASDYLHPARPEYLRRGTPVYITPDYGTAIVWRVDHDSIGPIPVVWGHRLDGGTGLCACTLEQTHLDLRDPTARAHAAMPYTAMREVHGLWLVACSLAEHVRTDAQHNMAMTLCRARSHDPDVTVDQMRAALLWAEEVTDATE